VTPALVGRRGRAAGVVLAVALLLTGCSAATSVSGATPQWPARVDWGRDVVAPPGPEVTPVRIVRTSGRVTGAGELAGRPGPGGGARLTMRPGGAPPVVVVDYGQDVGGVPYVVVRGASGDPVLSTAYSEGLQYLGPDGDQNGSASSAGASSRTDDLIVAYPGRLTAGVIQGGERYERITLTTPGSVTLSSVGIRFTAVRATPGDYRGWFDSSSPELNRIWYDGAYTTQLDELPSGAVPAPWRISGGVLEAVGGGAGILSAGTGWTDYSVSFDTRVLDYSSGWLVRATSGGSGYLFTLQQSAGTGSGASLQEIDLSPTDTTSIGTVPLPAGFRIGRWHHVTTTVSGTRVTTSIDGRQVSTFDAGSLPPGSAVHGSGSVGFVTTGSTALFRDLAVTGTGGTRLYADALSHPSALAGFPALDVAPSDPLPVIMDGAKRDRVVWSGDLGVEVPNVLYTTRATDFVRGSLELLGSYQVADGESGTNVNPTVPLGTFPQSGSTYSTVYSMDEVDNIATYYLYTGDLSFVRAEWPMITRELAYNQSLVDDRGLLVTDAADGQDWDYYDGSKTGEVAAYNVIYYETLVDAGSLAAALGLPLEAYAYGQAAARLRSAIDQDLFDPTSGLYELSDAQPSAVAQDANALAVLFGVAPPGSGPAVMAALRRTLPSTPYGPESFTANAGFRAAVSPFVTNEEVQALFATGDGAAAIGLIERLWGHMDAPGPDFTAADWELVGARGRPGFGDNTSLAHGWASGATADLSSDVLGVVPSTPGFRTWTVAPRPGSLRWAEGDVPTPHGTIAVRWARSPGSGRFSLQVSAPAHTRGTVAVPVGKAGATVTVRTSGAGGRTLRRATRTARPGVSSLPVAVGGGFTTLIEVVPR